MEPPIIVLVVFVLITLLTALAVLGAAVGWLPQASDRLITWGIPAVLGEIVLTVVMYFRTQWGQRIRINVTFGALDPADVALDTARCSYVIKDSSGKEVRGGPLGPTIGPGGWQVQLPSGVSADQSVTLSLGTRTGDTWEVRPFRPLFLTQAAVKSE